LRTVTGRRASRDAFPRRAWERSKYPGPGKKRVTSVR
jgi:hypothetical protein